MGIFNWKSSKSSDVMEFADFERQVNKALLSGDKEEAKRLLMGKVRCPKCSSIVEPAVGWMGSKLDRVILCSSCKQIWIAHLSA